jgi:hypothetical protein
MTRYIAFRLVRAGNGRPNVDFSRAALEIIFERSGGVPRIVNLICDNAMLVGYSNDTRLIDSGVVRRAISQMLPNFDVSSVDDLLSDTPVDAPAVAEKEMEDGRRL